MDRQDYEIFFDRNKSENLPNIDINFSGHCSLDKCWTRNDACDECSRLYFLLSGEAYITHKGIKQTLVPGYVYLIPPNTTFSYTCVSLKKIFFHISVLKSDGYDVFQNLDEIFSLPYPLEETQNLLNLYKSNDYISLLKLKTELLNIMIRFSELAFKSPVIIHNHSSIVNKTIAYVNENVNINLSVKDIANHFSVSESTLRRTFKREMEVSLGKYIEDVVIIKAKLLLKKSTMSILEISETFGFYDQFHFSKRFKERVGLSPSAYRKNPL